VLATAEATAKATATATTTNADAATKKKQQREHAQQLVAQQREHAQQLVNKLGRGAKLVYRNAITSGWPGANTDESKNGCDLRFGLGDAFDFVKGDEGAFTHDERAKLCAGQEAGKVRIDELLNTGDVNTNDTNTTNNNNVCFSGCLGVF
jgi:hypothetical protein